MSEMEGATEDEEATVMPNGDQSLELTRQQQVNLRWVARAVHEWPELLEARHDRLEQEKPGWITYLGPPEGTCPRCGARLERDETQI